MSDVPKPDQVVKVYTVGMKRRGVVRVLKSVMRDAQRETGRERVTGIFGVVVREDGQVNVISAVTADEMRLVLQAVPEALNLIAMQMVKGAERDKPH